MSAPFAEDVAEYLKTNPGFFEQYADLLAQIYVPHPHGGRAKGRGRSKKMLRATKARSSRV